MHREINAALHATFSARRDTSVFEDRSSSALVNEKKVNGVAVVATVKEKKKRKKERKERNPQECAVRMWKVKPLTYWHTRNIY